MRLQASTWFGITQWKVTEAPGGTRVFGSEQEALDFISETLNEYHAEQLGASKYDAAFLACCGIKV